MCMCLCSHIYNNILIVHMAKYIVSMAPPSSDHGAPMTQPNIWTQNQNGSKLYLKNYFLLEVCEKLVFADVLFVEFS